MNKFFLVFHSLRYFHIWSRFCCLSYHWWCWHEFGITHHKINIRVLILLNEAFAGLRWPSVFIVVCLLVAWGMSIYKRLSIGKILSHIDLARFESFVIQHVLMHTHYFIEFLFDFLFISTIFTGFWYNSSRSYFWWLSIDWNGSRLIVLYFLP